MAVIILFAGFSSAPAGVPGFPRGSLEEALFEDASDGTLNRVSLEQAALIASGVSQDDLVKYIQKIDSLYNHIALRWPMKKLTAMERGQIILYFLHRTTLRFYDPSATEIQKALDEGRFNCVSATLLFNVLCARFGVPVQGVEIPAHVYSAVVTAQSPQGVHEVQPTVPEGFRTTSFRSAPVPAELMIETWKGKRFLNDVPLVAVIYYNRGIEWIRRNNYAAALPFYERAYILDPDFPALASLIAEIYTAWGNQFFAAGDYRAAIAKYSMGLSFVQRTGIKADRTALKANLAASYINEANAKMNESHWDDAAVLLESAWKTGVKLEVSLHNLKALYYRRGQSCVDRQDWQAALKTYREALKRFPQEDGFRKNLSWTYAKIGTLMVERQQFEQAREWFQMAYRETGESSFARLDQIVDRFRG